LTADVILTFSDGKTVRYPASMLYAALPQAEEALTEPDEE